MFVFVPDVNRGGGHVNPHSDPEHRVELDARTGWWGLKKARGCVR